jgi:hypothetical protein
VANPIPTYDTDATVLGDLELTPREHASSMKKGPQGAFEAAVHVRRAVAFRRFRPIPGVLLIRTFHFGEPNIFSPISFAGLSPIIGLTQQNAWCKRSL